MFETIKNIFGGLVTKAQVEAVNPNLQAFEKVNNEEDEVLEHSVVDRAFKDSQSKADFEIVNAYKNMVYGNVGNDKVERLKFYRSMAKFPEISDALDEIADAFLNYDEDHKFVNINFSNSNDITAEQKKILADEFENFISMYDFENYGFDYVKDLLSDAEVTWENIIDPKEKSMGIIGIRRIPVECYEYLIDKNYDIKGIIFNAKVNGSSDLKMNTNGFQNIQDIYDYRDPEKRVIPLSMEQVTHINSGCFDSTKTIAFPVLEKARRSYRQLSLIEDAIIIYRLVRAPERLVFNIDTGKLPPAKSEELVYKLMKRYQSKKVYDPVNGTVTKDYDPHQMQESFWFPKPEGSQGTTVTKLEGGQNLGELNDLNYFLRKLYISLKVPYNRYEQSDTTLDKDEMINYEEYRFSKFIIRIQNRFSLGLFESFKVHLKLKGFWKKYKLNPRSFTVRFNPPSAFDLYSAQKLFNIKLQNYDSITTHEEFSKELAMKKYLGMSEYEIEENNKRVEAEIIRRNIINKKSDNVMNYGIPDDMPLPKAPEQPLDTGILGANEKGATSEV